MNKVLIAALGGTVRARCRDCVSELTVEEELAAGEFIAQLWKPVQPELSTKPERMVADHPREGVDELVIFVVDLERAAGWVAEASEIL